VAHQGLRGWFKTASQNCEMPAFTQALYDARELALSRVQCTPKRTVLSVRDD
jgi:hypothetical protein